MNPQLQLMLQQAIQAFQGGNLDSAGLILNRVLEADAKNLPALHILGLIKASQSNFKEAANYLARAARIHPNDASIQYNLAKALADSGDDKNALAHHKKAVALAPNNPEAWLNYGKTTSNLGFYEEALVCYDKALALKSDYAEAALNKGATLRELKRYKEAIIFADQALAINPTLAEAWSNKGIVLKDLKRFDEALDHYDKAISLKPDYHEAWSNKGVTLHELKRFDEALDHYDKAISLKPDYHEAWGNKGVTLHELKRFDEALDHYDKAISLKPDYHEAAWNKSLSLLLQGDFENGLPFYEARWSSEKVSEIVGKRFFDKPIWLGNESLQGKTILLYGEQGFGDFIQFCRYVSLVSNLGAKVILESPEPLAGLMENLEGVSQLIVRGQNLPPFDFQCPLLSLPLAFKTNLDNIPKPFRYINLDSHPNKLAEWSARLGPKLKPRVGLVWSGSTLHKNDHNRSLLLKDILSYLPQQFEYVSLQKEIRDIDREILESNPHILSFAIHLNDFLDTAALIQDLDLVISVDTSVAHLSAAMGKKTFVLLPSIPDWRWLLDREDSPWYPSTKLYRQVDPGVWNGVLERVQNDLNRI